MATRLNLVSSVLILGFLGFLRADLDIKDFAGGRPLDKKRIVEDILLYYQQDDPHGIPVLTIPDPFNLDGAHQASSMTLTNLTISGHGGLRLEHLGVNLEDLTAQLRIEIPKLQLLSAYEWPGTFFSTSVGDMNVTFIGLEVGFKIFLGVDGEGTIMAEDFELQIFKDEFFPEFTGLITTHQAMIAVADTFFDTFIVPMIQSSATSKVLLSINERLKQRLAGQKFPTDISPVDFMIGKLRQDFLETKNLDPFVIEERELDLPLPVSLVIKKASVEGLSTLHRDKEISVELIDNRIYARIEISTKMLKVFGDWSLFTSMVPLGSGQADLAVDGLTIAIHVQQDADVRHPPILRDIDIQLGNLALLSKGDRNFDYLMESTINIFPNIFKNLILDKKVEGIIKQRVQEKFNTLDLEGIIKKRLEQL